MHAYDSRLVADTGIDVALVNGRTVRAASPLDIRALPKVNWACFNPLDYINMHIRTSPAYGRIVRPNPSKRARGGIERAQTANAQQEARAVERLGRRWIEQQAGQ